MPLKILYIAYYAVNFMKTNPIKEIQSECGVSSRDGGGGGLHRSSSLSYHASETLNQCQVMWFERHGWWPESFFFNLRFHCCKCKNVYRLNHVTCNQSEIGSNWNSNFPSFSVYISSSIMSIFATTTKKKGGGMILYVMNQVYNACVIQCTIQNFHHYYKLEI